MVKRLISFYVALHLALAPVASAFASMACHSFPSQGETAHCKHHHEAASRQQNPEAGAHKNCHSRHDQDKASHAKCSCHCAASAAGLVNTFTPRLAQGVSASMDSPVKTRLSVTDTPLFKPPRA